MANEKTAYTHEDLAEDLKSGHAVIASTFPPTQDGTVPSIKVGRVVSNQNTPVSGEHGPLVDQQNALLKSSGIDGDAGDWTAAGQDASGFPVAKGSATDVSSKPATTAAEKLPAPEPSDDDKKAASIDQDLHPEKYKKAGTK